MRRSLRFVTVWLIALTLFLPAGAPPALAVTVWTGKVIKVQDGDTYDVRLRDGTVQRIRMAGIQAMELDDYVKKVGDCHGPEADRRLNQLIGGKTVRISAVSAASTSLGRKLRFTEVRRSGRWVDVGQILINEGHAIWSPHPVEHIRNRSYNSGAAQAARRGRNLWNPTHCGRGPAQAVPLEMRIQWDADGADNRNPNGEWAEIVNHHPTATLSLRGWQFRDSALRYYKFPSTAKIPPGGSVYLHPGRGRNNGKHFYWNVGEAIFENIDASRNLGDGGYLFDPRGDLRTSFTYPCLVRCTDPGLGKLKISQVNWDAEGNDVTNPNGEWIDVTNSSLSTLRLEDYVLAYANVFTVPLRGELGPAETLRVRIGRGSDTALERFLGRSTGVLNNSGERVVLRTYSDIRLDCHRWGRGRC